MANDTYERPREKLRDKGVSALTNAELLQVIIGSGSAGLPVTKIARKLDKTLRQNGPTVNMEILTTIDGLGTVKASQILAGIELARRLEYQESELPHKDIDVLADLYADMRGAKKPTLLYAFFDGSGKLIDDNTQILNTHASTARIARKIFGDALAQSTASVLVAIGSEQQLLEPSMFELSLAKDVYGTASLLSISIKSFVLVGVKGEYVITQAGGA